MADWTFFDSSRFASRGTPSIGGGTVVGPTALHTKGPWHPLATVPFDTDLITVDEMRTVDSISGDKGVLFDVARGTPGSEQVLFSNLPGSNSEDDMRVFHYRFPTELKSDERLSARLQSEFASYKIAVGFRFQAHGFAHPPTASRTKTYGAVSATSRLTVVTAGAANTKVSWVQLTASTSEDIAEIILVAGDEAASGLTSAWYLVDVAIGPSGSEKIIIPDIPFTSFASGSGLNPYLIGPLPCSIPAGSRIAVRFQSTATDRNIGFAIIGISR